MNAKTIAATLVVIGGLSVGTATANANGNGRGPGNDGGCGNGQQQGCEPDRGDECSNGQHSGNPHCDPDSTPTPVPTPVPTVEPTPTPTLVATDQPIDPCDGPRAQLPANCFVVTTPAGPPIVVQLPPAVAAETQPVFTFGTLNPVTFPADDDFDVSQITSLPHAGDGSAADSVR